MAAGLTLFSERIDAHPPSHTPLLDTFNDASRTSEDHHPPRDDVRFWDTGADRRMAVTGAKPNVRFCAKRQFGVT
ncbi:MULTISPECIES: hypothetical protein [unclassified Methylobacterium]|uniref:hypothetical protein n=1 Tax=unclassified Methylobacterium TaxID=2615210 RepID=UPI00034599D0|nr:MULTISPECIES: hypothetical protein [unclassified Methylobacterium]